MTSELPSSASLRTRRRVAGVLTVLLAVVGALFTVGVADACACGGPPLVPQNVTATQSGAGEVTLTWDAPTDSGTTAVTSYSAGWTASQAGFGEELGAGVRTDTFTDLDAGTRTFWVYATNSFGNGPRGEVTLTVVGAEPTLAVSRTVRTAASDIVVSGVWTAGEELTLERTEPGGAWSSIGTITVDDTNHYSKSVTVTRTASYRVRATGDVLSAARKVTANNRVTLNATRKGLRTYRLAGHVYPGVEGQVVRLYVARNGGYSGLKTVRTTSTGYFSYKHQYAARDTYKLKAVSASTTRNAPGNRAIEVAVH